MSDSSCQTIIKPNASVLDCTAANRCFWIKRESDKVLWTDIEPELEIPADMIVDIRNTEFEDGQFNTIIFDPPHWWGDTIGKNVYALRNWKDAEEYNERYGTNSHVSYYGCDKYITKKSLLGFINRAQREIYRILDDGGVLWFNWSDVKISLDKILPFFDSNWDVMIKLPIGSKKQTRSTHQNWWVMMMKNNSSHTTKKPFPRDEDWEEGITN